jgi:hypothetical protein
MTSVEMQIDRLSRIFSPFFASGRWVGPTSIREKVRSDERSRYKFSYRHALGSLRCVANLAL